MDSFRRTEAAKKHLADVYINDRVRIEKLRKILETELGRPFTYEQARSIGTDLVSFYKSLAEGKKLTYGEPMKQIDTKH